MSSPSDDDPTRPRPPAAEPAEPFTLPYTPPPETGTNPYRALSGDANPYQPVGFGQQQPAGTYAPQPYPPAYGYGVPTPPLQNPYAAPPAEPIHFPPETWLVFVSAALAVAGAFVPWFRPYGTDVQGRRVLTANHALYSWQDGRVGLLAPVLLVIFAVGVVRMLRGANRFSGSKGGPVMAVGRWALVAGALTVVSVLGAYAMVPSQFSTPAEVGGTWSSVKAYGISMSRGPQTGLWLTLTAAGLSLLCGLALIVSGTRHRPAGR